MATPSISDLMEERLPSYVVNCFIAAGYDTYEAIASMTISSPPGFNDSIEEIQKYVAAECPDDPKYCHQQNPSARASVFPPGHIFLIKNFIKEAKHELQIQRKRKYEPPNTCELPKRSKSDTTASLPLSKVYDSLRKNIIKWQRNKQFPLSTLREHVDYEIVLKIVDGNQVNGSIECKKCGKIIKLQERNHESGEIMCSNWYRHLQSDCKEINSKSRISPITSYFTSQSNLEGTFTASTSSELHDAHDESVMISGAPVPASSQLDDQNSSTSCTESKLESTSFKTSKEHDESVSGVRVSTCTSQSQVDQTTCTATSDIISPVF